MDEIKGNARADSGVRSTAERSLRSEGTLSIYQIASSASSDLVIQPIYEISHNSGLKRISRAYPTLVRSRQGSPENGGGTWLHPDLAMQCAQWCNKPFAIQVSRWNLNQMANATGKRIDNWMRLKETQELIAEFDRQQSVPSDLRERSQAIVSARGGTAAHRFCGAHQALARWGLVVTESLHPFSYRLSGCWSLLH